MIVSVRFGCILLLLSAVTTAAPAHDLVLKRVSTEEDIPLKRFETEVKRVFSDDDIPRKRFETEEEQDEEHAGVAPVMILPNHTDDRRLSITLPLPLPIPIPHPFTVPPPPSPGPRPNAYHSYLYNTNHAVKHLTGGITGNVGKAVSWLEHETEKKAVIIYDGLKGYASQKWHDAANAVNHFRECVRKDFEGITGCEAEKPAAPEPAQCFVGFRDTFGVGVTAGCKIPKMALATKFAGETATMQFKMNGVTKYQTDLFAKQWRESFLKRFMSVETELKFTFIESAYIDLRYSEPDKYVLNVPGLDMDVDTELTLFAEASKGMCPGKTRYVLNKGHTNIFRTVLWMGPAPVVVEVEAEIYLQAKPQMQGRAEAKFRFFTDESEKGYTRGAELYDLHNNRGPDFFNKGYHATRSGILVRVCPKCYGPHKTIYYKRLTNISTFNPYECMVKRWDWKCKNYENDPKGLSNRLNVDFELYGSLEDLAQGRNRWTFCNYGGFYFNAFPLQCGPNGPVKPPGYQVFEQAQEAKFYAVSDGAIHLLDPSMLDLRHPTNALSTLRGAINEDGIVSQIKEKLKMEISGKIEASASLDLCLGVLFRVRVEGIGTSVDVPICLEGKVAAAAEFDLNGGRAQADASLHFKSLFIVHGVELPKLADTIDSACEFVRNLDPSKGQCVPVKRCFDELIENTCNSASAAAQKWDKHFDLSGTTTLFDRTLWEGHIEMEFPWGRDRPDNAFKKYEVITSGNCRSRGLEFIEKLSECKHAGVVVGISDEGSLDYPTSGGNRQKYCGTWGKMQYLHFNPQSSGIANGYPILQNAQDNARQICRDPVTFHHVGKRQCASKSQNKLLREYCCSHHDRDTETKEKCQKKCRSEEKCVAYSFKRSYTHCLLYEGKDRSDITSGAHLSGKPGHPDADCYVKKKPVQVNGCASTTRFNPEYSSLSASSVYGNQAIGGTYGQGRLESQQAWSAARNEAGQWWQIDCGGTKVITGVHTQGRKNYDQWVTSYTVRVSLDGVVWSDVDAGSVFAANSDRNTIVSNSFSAPVEARFVRIVAHRKSGWVSMRAALEVCNGGSCAGLSDQSWSWNTYFGAGDYKITLLSSAKAAEIANNIKNKGYKYYVDTDVKMHVRRDGSWSDSYIKYIRTDTGEQETFVFRGGYADHTNVEIVDGGQKIQCNANRHRTHYRCNSLVEGEAVGAIITEVYFHPRSGKAHRNQWHRNRFTWSGTKYRVCSGARRRIPQITSSRIPQITLGVERRRSIPTKSTCPTPVARIKKESHQCTAMAQNGFDESMCGTNCRRPDRPQRESYYALGEFEVENGLTDFDVRDDPYVCTLADGSSAKRCRSKNAIQTCETLDSRTTWVLRRRIWYGCCNEWDATVTPNKGYMYHVHYTVRE